MELTNIKDLFREKEKLSGKKVTVGGWVRSNRDSKTFGFLVVNDGSFFEPLQMVYSDQLADFAAIAKIGVGAAVMVTGTIVVTPGAKQPFEMQAEEVVVEGASPSDYPLQKKRHSFEYLRTISHLRAENEYLPGGIPRPFPGGVCHSPLFPGKGLRLCAHAADHRKRL